MRTTYFMKGGVGLDLYDDERDSLKYVKQCTRCTHYHQNGMGAYTCGAFPDGKGIPADIWMGRVDHTEPYEGDHGIQYEARANIEKAKKYLKHDQKAPAGYREQRGPKGGRWYETEARNKREGAEVPKQKHTADDINQILHKDLIWNSTPHPELKYLHGTRIGPGILRDGHLANMDSLWFVDNGGQVSIVPEDLFDDREARRIKEAEEEARQEAARKKADVAAEREKARREADRARKRRNKEEVEHQKEVRGHTLPVINAILKDCADFNGGLVPDLHYLDGTEVEPGTVINGMTITGTGLEWYISEEGDVTIAPTGKEEEIKADFDRKKRKRVMEEHYRDKRHVNQQIEISEDLWEIIHLYGKKIAPQIYETAYCFDVEYDGIIWEKDGEQDHVRFNKEELRDLPGAVLLHNHPNCSSFSEADMHTACTVYIREMVVYGLYKNKWVVYRFRPPEGQPTFRPEDWKKIQPVYKRIDDALFGEYQAKCLSGEMTEVGAMYEHSDRSMKAMAEETGMRYERIITERNMYEE